MKILHIIIGSANAGGVGSVVYNYMKHIDQDKYHFDFALLGCKPGMIGKEMVKLGAHCYELPLKSIDIQGYKKQLYEILTSEGYDAIHVHENSTSFVALRVAKKAGVKCRIAHAHTAFQPNSFKSWLKVITGRFLNYIFATKLIGCGQKAGEYVFGKSHMKSSKALVLPNAIEAKHFQYNERIRNEVRYELNLGGKYTIGMIGRFSTQKNHAFALPMIHSLYQRMHDFVLVMVGTGELEVEVKKYCKENDMEEYTQFLGVRKDMTRVYQALDVCILPSLWEGFPVVGLEAIASGLPLILSDKITPELFFSSNVSYQPLNETKWVEILQQKPMNNHREAGYEEIKMNGFDIHDTMELLEKAYDEAK